MQKILIIVLILLSQSVYSQNNTLPNRDLTDIEGKVVNTKEIHNDGKPFVVCFWAVWCKPCLLELNSIMEKYDEWEKEYGIKLYAISTDSKERQERAKEYALMHEWHYKVLFDEGGALEHDMQINGVPHLMLFDGEGKLVWQEHEYNHGMEEKLIKAIESIK